MLAVSSLRNDENQGEKKESYLIGANDFPDFSDGNLLDSIDFDDLFVGDMLPDLEMDSEILAEFSVSGGEESEMNTSMSVEKFEYNTQKEEDDKVSGSGSGSGLNSNSSSSRGEEIVSKRDESVGVNPPAPKEADKGRKSSTHSKNSHGKRKVKVDWTPELHRRFVQAVEQLGVDKAVPSRILELMGIDCLTRHNIASHLEKYRSHRKHLLAREAEAASWSQRRQMYGAPGGGGGKRDMSPWLAPTMGFPPITPMHHFRPLHVWGHPTMDQSLMPMWPKHLAHSPSPPPPPPTTWLPAPPPPPPDPSYWQHHHQRVPNVLTPGTPCFPRPLPTTRFVSPPVPGIPPHAMYKVEPGIGVPPGQSSPHPPLDSHPVRTLSSGHPDSQKNPTLRQQSPNEPKTPKSSTHPTVRGRLARVQLWLTRWLVAACRAVRWGMKAKNHSLGGWPLMEAPTATFGMCGFNGSAKSSLVTTMTFDFSALCEGAFGMRRK